MAEDRVLRCLVYATIDGDEGWKIIDCFEQGDCYIMVLNWWGKPGEQTESPGKQAGVKKPNFEAISDPNAPYELRCLHRINFDKFTFTDVSRDANEIWRSGHNLFYPRPED
jgi:hypothetical protein